MDATQAWIANVAILEEQLRRETWFNTLWGQFFRGNVEIITDDNGNKDVTLSGKPIETLTEPMEEGRDNILLPFLRDLTGLPVYGDTVLKGTGEDMVMFWLRAYINQERKAVFSRSGQMAEQRELLYKLFDKARPLLGRWWGKWINQNIFRAFYEGISSNLSASNVTDALGIFKRYHPNWYVNDGGVLTAVGTDKNTKSAAELDTAVTNADTDMGVDILAQFRIQMMKLKIPELVTEGGFRFWMLIVHPDTGRSLLDDASLQVRSAFDGLQNKHPEIQGAVGFIQGFAIFEDLVGIRGWTSADDVFFAADDADIFTFSGETNNFNSIAVGASAMGHAVGKDLHFTKEIDDHENTIEIGGAVIHGFNRPDYFAEADAFELSGDAFRKDTTGGVANGLTAINQSSAILMTDESA